MNEKKETGTIQHNRIKEVRKRHGITLKHISDSLGTTPTHIQRIENGTRNLNMDVLMRIAKAMGVPPQELLPGGCEVCHEPKERAILQMFRQLDERGQQSVQAFLAAIAQQAKVSNDDGEDQPDFKTGK